MEKPESALANVLSANRLWRRIWPHGSLETLEGMIYTN